MLILSLVPFRPTAHIGADRIRSNYLLRITYYEKKKLLCTIRTLWARTSQIYTVRQRRGARRRVLPSLRRFNCRAPRLRSSSSSLFRSLSCTCDHPRLPSLCGILYTVPFPICLSLPFSLSRFLHLSSFSRSGHLNASRMSELWSKYAGYASILANTVTEDVITAKLRNRCKDGCRYRNKKVIF